MYGRKKKMNSWDKAEAIAEAIGRDMLLDELMAALCEEELTDLLDFIAKNHDLDIEEEEEEEEEEEA